MPNIDRRTALAAFAATAAATGWPHIARAAVTTVRFGSVGGLSDAGIYLADELGYFAAAGIAVENARLHQRAGEVAVYEDRDRLARDLHDGVIQRLFAIGLSLQGLAATPGGRVVSPGLESAIADIDETIRQVRATIFELGGAGNGRGIRSHVLALAEELRPVVGFDVPVEFKGAVDTAVTDAVADQLLPTLREALTNIGRHSEATRARIRLSMVGRFCRMEVTDNGKGFVDAQATEGGMGLANMRARAEGLGGTLEVTHPALGGTTVVWQVPTFNDRAVVPAGDG